MDTELLIALVVLWLSTTSALITFLRMWFSFDGEAFHPHSVDVEHRHGLFLVVNSRTICKIDCPIMSISAFVAPRGSSSSKQFSLLIVMIAVAGFLGTSRWYALGGVHEYPAALSFAGFSSLLFVAAFELDVVPERYLEDKLRVTAWFIEKLKMDHLVPFSLHPNDEGFRDFIRSSKEIYHLFEEDIYIINRPKKLKVWTYHSLWSIGHMLGATGYICFLPAAILLHDNSEVTVASITGILFFFFCVLSYFSGQYVPMFLHFRMFRGYVLAWNPFLREPHFIIKLKKSIEDYCKDRPTKLSPEREVKGRRRTIVNNDFSFSSSKPSAEKLQLASLSDSFLAESESADKILDNPFLRFARRRPKDYLRILSQIIVLVELVAMLTPSVGIGLQWVTALCDTPSLFAMIDLLGIIYSCVISGNCHQSDKLQHCILKS